MHLYNSKTKVQEKLIFNENKGLKMYVCGPTVYASPHIGNARSVAVYDLLYRLLKLRGNITYVRNITDVDDKINKAALENGETIFALTQRVTEDFQSGMAAIGCLAPTHEPRVTDNIAEVIAVIEKLIENGNAYVAEGHVLFDVPSDPTYGMLSGRSRDEQIAGARVDVAPYKKDPADFVLWKPSSGDEPGWDSPWGFGRPGWHIECSAMSEKHLGLPFDIHGGGADLKFPHHENEIAQAVCAHGHAHDPAQFSKYWVHNGFVTVDGEKMSKSLGNFLLVHDLIQKYPGEVLRLTLLSAHYRQPLDWSDRIVEQNVKLLDKMYAKMKGYEGPAGDIPAEVMDALCDDLNTPMVIAALNALIKKDDLLGLKAAGNMLGILQDQNWGASGQDVSNLDVTVIENLVAARTQAKQEKDFAKADSIRAELIEMGVIVEDTAQGPVWKKA
jgi:cysteinyl-tRNA synthetase